MRLFVCILVVFGVMIALSTVVGLLFWVGVAWLIIACVVSVVRSSIDDHTRTRPPGRRQERSLDKLADQALRELEQKNQKQ